MTEPNLGVASRTRYGWAKALQLAPDLYPGVGGKRLRATLLQRAFEFAGGEGRAPEMVIDAVEMLHVGSLVIDDFEDDSQTRRGQPALHRIIGPARAVNAGNWMYFKALELAATAYPDFERTAAVLGRFIAVARRCHEGQAVDLSTRVDEVTPRQAHATALAISRWKTGRLVSLAAWCGAHAAGADRHTLRAAAAFGCRLGVCLQMKNDLDELSELVGGADRCDDLKNRRVTWPWVWAARELSPTVLVSLQERLRRTLARPEQLRGLAKVLLDATHGRAAVVINSRLDQATDRLAAATDRTREIRPLAEVANALRIVSESSVSEATL